MNQTRLLPVIVALFGALATNVSAQDDALASRVRSIVSAANLGDGVGVSVVDLAGDRTVVDVAASTPRNPASNMKLITAAVALSTLGPDFRMTTSVHGTIEGDAVVGGLVIRGRGDPTLTRADLVELAEQLWERGVRRVDEVVVDATYFDDRTLPPAFEQQPNEIAPFRAAVGALSVDENAYVLRIAPGAAAGAAAEVHVDAATHFDVTNEATTVASGAPRVMADQRMQRGQLALRVRGTIAQGAAPVEVRRRIEDPLRFAGHAFVEALRRVGIRTQPRVRIGEVAPNAQTLATHRSEALSVVLHELGKNSDNFVAEMVLKVVAAERRRGPGTTENGCAEALAFLQRSGASAEGATCVNGSGLFQGNLIAPAQFTRLLATMYRDVGLRPEYLAELAIGGVDGTLSRRFEGVPRGIVRAKTGTLGEVIALSGYVLAPGDRAPVVFSVLVNGVGGRHAAARQMIDDVVRAIVDSLHPPAR